MRHYPGPGMGGSSMLWGFFGFIGTMVVLGLLTLLVIYLVQRSRGQRFGPNPMAQSRHRPPMPPALQVLDERLARGEIEVEDYLSRKAALLGTAGPVPNEWTPEKPAPQPDDAEPDGEDKPAG